MTEHSTYNRNTTPARNDGWLSGLGWVLAGAAYGIFLRVFFGIIPAYLDVNGVMSAAFLLGTPFVVGAITIYGRRHQELSIGTVIFAPWGTVALMLLGSAVALLEGSICIALMTPLFLFCGSAGGVVMGLILHFGRPGAPHVGGIAVLPFLMMIAEIFAPMIDSEAEIRQSVLIDASPQRVWEEIMTAEEIHASELPLSLSHLIGVPKPVEGVNRITPEGEIRYSRWERGVSFEALVTERKQYESIRWHYSFDAHSFPEGSMDQHVEIGGNFFGLQDTTFNLTPLPNDQTELEIVAHYRVTSGINFYAVPVARVLGHDFVNTILGLYKGRSEVEERNVSTRNGVEPIFVR